MRANTTLSFDHMFKDFCAQIYVQSGKDHQDWHLFSADFKARIEKARLNPEPIIFEDNDAS